MAETSTSTGNLESKADAGKPPAGSVSYWLAEIKAYDKTFEAWEARASAVVKRYRNEGELKDELIRSTQKFNVLWANVQTLQPALYSTIPKPDISRTHKDKDQVARSAAVILERAVRQEIIRGGFDEAMQAARDDYLLTARGVIWNRYVPTYGDETTEKLFLQADPNAGDGMLSYTNPDGTPYTEDPKNPIQFDGAQAYVPQGQPFRPVIAECSKQEHIPWKDFGHTPAPTWSKVRAVWKREMMTRGQLIERFGTEKGKAIGLTKSVENVTKEDQETYGDAFKRGEVFEIWDITTKKVLWISKGYSEGPLDEIDDPLKLEGFFPCPPPVYGTTTTDSLIPVTDYDEYRTQAEEIDALTARIGALTKALGVKGAYDGNVSELGKILDGAENKLIAVDNWTMFAERGGLPGAISFLPIKEIADTVVALGALRDQLKRDLQEITGISDIVRGQTDPNETLGAQQIKRQFVGMRIQDRQSNIGKLARGVVQITAEIIAEHFSPETLWEISGWIHSDEARAIDKALSDWQTEQQQAQQPPPMGHNGGPPMDMGTGQPPDMTNGQGMDPTGQSQPGMMPQSQPATPPPTDRPPSSKDVFDQAVQLLRSDKLRGYTISVDTDQMVFQDQKDEQQQGIDLVTAVSGYLKEAVPAAIQYPALANALIEMLMLTVRRFKAGPSIEAALEQAMTAMADQASQPQQPDPAAEEAKARIEALKIKSQADQAKAQSDQTMASIQVQAVQQKLQADQQAATLAAQIQERTGFIQLQTLQTKAAADAQRHQQDMLKGSLDIRRLEMELAALQQTHAADMMAQATPAPQPAHPPSESISYKDVPPDAQAQMLEQAGIHTSPQTIAAYDAAQKAAAAKQKAAAARPAQPAAKAAKKPAQGP